EDVALSHSDEFDTASVAHDFADDVGRLVSAAQVADHRIGFVRPSDGDHAEAVVESAIHFDSFDMPMPLDHREDRRHRPASSADNSMQTPRHRTGQVFYDSAAGDVGETPQAKATENRAYDRRVDARRTQQLVGKRAAEFVDARIEAKS